MAETPALMTTLKQTPLNALHRQLGARMVEFGGWDMPVQYAGGILEEHRAVREAAGLFDVSHMGEFEIRGPDAAAFLSHVVTNDPAPLQTGQAQYTVMCYPHGGAVDDLIIFKLGEDDFLAVVNASNTEKDFEWMQGQTEGFNVSLVDRSLDYGLIALQGPRAVEILRPLTPIDLDAMPNYSVRRGPVAGVESILSRTGYTGEDGIEIMVAWDATPQVWQALLDAGAPLGLKPAGLGARDTLRLEAAMPLYGHELDANTNPLECGLNRFVVLDKPEFIGRDVLATVKTNGPSKRLVGLEMLGRGIPRQGYTILKDGQTIGAVTSGTQSPTLGKAIGMAYVEPDYNKVGTEVDVLIRGAAVAARIVKRPFYKRPK